MRDRFLALGVFVAAFALYAHGAAPSVTAGDSGEFMTAAATLALAHAPSYPLYSILGRLFLAVVPFGAVGVRMNYFSAFASAATLMLTFLIGRRVGASRLASLATAATIAGVASFWMNSLVTEVFALNTFFAALLVYCLSRMDEGNGTWDILFCFVLGLGLGNHQVLVFAAPAFAVFLLNIAPSGFASNRIGAYAAAALIGLSIYLFLPIRSSRQPPLNWGQPVTVEKLYRTITRKDYGSLKLAIGEAPPRDFESAERHVARFARQMEREAPWPILLLGLAGLALGLRRKRAFYAALVTLFVVTGPFFSWLGNLPFNGQSDGIYGRFLILPMFALLLGLIEIGRLPKLGATVTALAAVLLFTVNQPAAAEYRNGTLVLDYGRAMLRSMPTNGALFLDGGDDAFYSLALLHLVENQRPDIIMHDRGGLVFPNPYGDDFRSLDKKEKEARRLAVEQAAMRQRRLLYSTMDLNAMPGTRLRQRGFLYEAGALNDSGIDWPLICLRFLYPLEPSDYRTRALACFFPYMMGRQALDSGNLADGLDWYRRAAVVGTDVDWVRENMGYDLARLGYEHLSAGHMGEAEHVYLAWILIDPNSAQAQCNLGVVYERQNRLEEAIAQYERAARQFPTLTDPVFNLAVLAWHRSDWKTVVANLEEVLRRQPGNAKAAAYLQQARAHLPGAQP
jgi:tetratricopeptide (TPR) repeat protein